MISEELEIDILPSSQIESLDDEENFIENKKITSSSMQSRTGLYNKEKGQFLNSSKTKRGRPPKTKKKNPHSKLLSNEERKSDESPEIIMLGSSKAKLARANTIIKKIKKKFTSSKIQKKVAPVGIPKVTKPVPKPQVEKSKPKYQSVILSFKTFLKELKTNMQRTLVEGDKILKDIEL